MVPQSEIEAEALLITYSVALTVMLSVRLQRDPWTSSTFGACSLSFKIFSFVLFFMLICQRSLIIYFLLLSPLIRMTFLEQPQIPWQGYIQWKIRKVNVVDSSFQLCNEISNFIFSWNDDDMSRLGKTLPSFNVYECLPVVSNCFLLFLLAYWKKNSEPFVEFCLLPVVYPSYQWGTWASN